MDPITISLNPTYYCNFRCNFCYLTDQQLSDRTLLPIEKISTILQQIATTREIQHIDLYGGEILLVDEEYIKSILDIAELVGVPSVNIITNLSCVKDVLYDHRVAIAVSFDFECREQHHRVWKNIQTLNKDVHILMLASPDLIKKDVDEMIQLFNMQLNIKTVEIKPYSPNSANALPMTHEDYEEFIQRWITSIVPKRFNFTNQTLLQQSLANNYHTFSDDHVYVTPSGTLAVLEFAPDDTEYFLEVDSIGDYEQWARNEKVRIRTSPICGTCEYMGRCNTEHYRYVTELTPSCDGHIQLIQWFKNTWTENNAS